MKMLLKIKNGTPPMRKSALRQITDKAREFGAGSLVNQILPLLMAYRFLLAFRSGAVGIYNLSLKKMEFCTEAGHTETIFDLQFKPDNPNLMATVSYDGTTKIWDI